MMHVIQRFKQLPKPIMWLHLVSKLILGLGIGVLAAQYVHGYGWWVVLAALIISLPLKYQMSDAIRTFSPTYILMLVAAEVVFGIGLGIVFINTLSGFGWLLIGAAVILGIPGCYLVYKK